MNRGQRRAQWRSRLRRKSMERPSAATVPPLTAPSNPGLSTPRRTGSVQVRIDELVLRGFNRGAARAIAKGLEHELGQRLTMHGVPDKWINARSSERADSARISIRAGENGHSIGERLAQALCEIPGRGNQ